MHAITVGVEQESPVAVPVDSVQIFMMHCVIQSHTHVHKVEVVGILQRVSTIQLEIIKANLDTGPVFMEMMFKFGLSMGCSPL